MISFCFVLLVNNVKSDSLSFSFSKFEPGIQFDIGFLGDARVVDGAIQLTRRDGGSYDNPIIRKHSVDRAVYIPPVRLWDKTTGTLANFGTLFTFVVDSAGSQIHTDGLSFFISPFDHFVETAAFADMCIAALQKAQSNRLMRPEMSMVVPDTWVFN
ncbi:Lectin Lectin beta chain Lectin alpha chain Precursor [Vigna angularis]|uniref:Lectin Lectin beta chain Lectin alpha chain n=1 Tax=Phaseolus angularis TaxID=3914 RepID=A0A8T0LBM2_PHAAN|nr:Lectin Lectin beta chain Lectin alpha chain Precursor [Vigna angularis]